MYIPCTYIYIYIIELYLFNKNKGTDMAGRISCCLNLPLPNTNSSQLSKPFFWRRTEEEIKPRKKTSDCCLVGFAAFVMISATPLSHVTAASASETAVVGSPVTATRWSEKRACPPWLQNSLETIVPENLPRPSTRRRWESVGAHVSHAPRVGAFVTRANKADCFSM
ncbi:PREDICTED: uncharacterized protein LOC104803822 [Tarenaya hassleriana]|uniref:uncharacterized protein LOC104803822 n=1 Tax=Tarenaya hassleriana TaxID=28532 RepID=UPI00053C13BC|nr:PREDICTED: uncharacterized protein LOC104803822 [Tarenaya hassleriana]